MHRPVFQLAMFFLFFFFFSYQKSYAMLYISDDSFLAKAAMAQSIMNGSSRMIFGLLYDKFGFKVISTLSTFYGERHRVHLLFRFHSSFRVYSVLL